MPLVSTFQVSRDLRKFKIVDATWSLKSNGISGYRMRHIRGARFFDIDAVCDKSTGLPHMLPSESEFARHMGTLKLLNKGNLGIANDDHVVVYDQNGVFSSPRVYWTFKAFGHENVSVLDGGLVKWLKEGLGEMSSGDEEFQKTEYKARFNPDLDYATLLKHVTDFQYPDNYVILDARPWNRYAGLASEPREGVRSGHIPGSLSLAYERVLNPDHTFKTREEIEAILSEMNVDPNRPIVTTCGNVSVLMQGSGVTASILYVAMEIAGRRVRVYDGSWAEWGSVKGSPIKVY